MIFTTVCTIRLCRINDHVWFCASIQECWFNIFWTDIWITLSFCFGFDLMNSLLLWIYRFLNHSSIVWLFHPILSPTISVSSTTRKISPEAASRAHHPFCLDLVMIGCSQHLPFAIFPFFSLWWKFHTIAQGYDLMFIRLWGTGHDLLRILCNSSE